MEVEIDELLEKIDDRIEVCIRMAVLMDRYENYESLLVLLTTRKELLKYRAVKEAKNHG